MVKRTKKKEAVEQSKALHEIVFELSDEHQLVDKRTGQEVQGMTSRDFYLSAPYVVCKDTGKITFSKVAVDSNKFGNHAFFMLLDSMSQLYAERLTKMYVFHEFAGREYRISGIAEQMIVQPTEVNPQLFPEHQPEGRPEYGLNAFGAKGTVYYTK